MPNEISTIVHVKENVFLMLIDGNSENCSLLTDRVKGVSLKYMPLLLFVPKTHKCSVLMIFGALY